MRSEVARDLSDSAFDFERVVVPALRPLLGSGQIQSVEGLVAKPLEQRLDILSGIDAWQMRDDEGLMRGIASRVQWCERSWDTFTVRARRPNGSTTEFQKRQKAMDSREGWLYPHLTIHAYVTPPRRAGSLLAAAVIRTRDLFAYGRWHQSSERVNPLDNVPFYWWTWEDLIKAQYEVGIVRRCAHCGLPSISPKVYAGTMLTCICR